MGTVIFVFHYIVALLMLHTILFGSYGFKEIVDKYGYSTYEPNDERYKYPLWAILVLIIVLFVPVLNIVSYGIWMLAGYCNDIVCFKSFLTKRY